MMRITHCAPLNHLTDHCTCERTAVDHPSAFRLPSMSSRSFPLTSTKPTASHRLSTTCEPKQKCYPKTIYTTSRLWQQQCSTATDCLTWNSLHLCICSPHSACHASRNSSLRSQHPCNPPRSFSSFTPGSSPTSPTELLPACSTTFCSLLCRLNICSPAIPWRASLLMPPPMLAQKFELPYVLARARRFSGTRPTSGSNAQRPAHSGSILSGGPRGDHCPTILRLAAHATCHSSSNSAPLPSPLSTTRKWRTASAPGRPPLDTHSARPLPMPQVQSWQHSSAFFPFRPTNLSPRRAVHPHLLKESPRSSRSGHPAGSPPRSPSQVHRCHF